MIKIKHKILQTISNRQASTLDKAARTPSHHIAHPWHQLPDRTSLASATSATGRLKMSLPPSTTNIANLPMDALKLTFSFVGPKQYRFIARVNRCFHETHLSTFPGDTTTYLTGSTIKHAEIWLDLVRNRSIHECALIASAASHGCMDTIRFLFERGCEWSESTCANAVMSTCMR